MMTEDRVKERPILFSGPMVYAILEGCKTQTRRALNRNKVYNGFAFDDPRIARACPYGQAGDQLWVRETWFHNNFGDIPVTLYRADWQPDEHTAIRWRPSIFMPRWASRITLEVVSVRVERVQSISQYDAVAEGMVDIARAEQRTRQPGEAPHDQFARLWDSINAARGYGWAVNPLVWVVEFKRVQP